MEVLGEISLKIGRSLLLLTAKGPTNPDPPLDLAQILLSVQATVHACQADPARAASAAHALANVTEHVYMLFENLVRSTGFVFAETEIECALEAGALFTEHQDAWNT
jgi:hypothetical protein